MDFRAILEEGREVIAIVGLIVIALVYPTEATVSGVIGALAGIIVGKKM